MELFSTGLGMGSPMPDVMHVHHWRLADSGAGALTPAYCIKDGCSEQRTFRTAGPDERWDKGARPSRQKKGTTR